MKFLNLDSIAHIKKDRIFKIANAAFERKKQGYSIYNATLGTLYNAEGVLHTHQHFYDVFNKIDDKQKAAYAPSVDGGTQFADAVKKWVFQDKSFMYRSSVVATPGGSGALFATFSKVVKPHETIIIPDIFWGPYELMMKSLNIIPTKCNVFDNGVFSLEPFKKAMKEVSQKQDNVVIVMNDPAHNPTGYSLGKETWEEFIAFCNEIAKDNKTVTIINDIAYIDYSRDFELSREYMESFKNINDNVMVVVAFSGSKTFTAYGMRIGAAIVYANDDFVIQSVHDVLENVARSTWSNVNSGAINTICALGNHQDAFKKDLDEAKKYLVERRDAFTKAADAVGLKYYATCDGFFITLMGVKDNEVLFEALKAKDIFVLPMLKGIRIAICSLNMEQCKKLPELIQKEIQEIEHAN